MKGASGEKEAERAVDNLSKRIKDGKCWGRKKGNGGKAITTTETRHSLSSVVDRTTAANGQKEEKRMDWVAPLACLSPGLAYWAPEKKGWLHGNQKEAKNRPLAGFGRAHNFSGQPLYCDGWFVFHCPRPRLWQISDRQMIDGGEGLIMGYTLTGYGGEREMSGAHQPSRNGWRQSKRKHR